MGCGCKKKSQPTQSVQTPSIVKLSEVSTTQQTEISLSEQQQLQVDAIVEKLGQLDETTR
jgi:hypothetical protein